MKGWEEEGRWCSMFVGLGKSTTNFNQFSTISLTFYFISAYVKNTQDIVFQEISMSVYCPNKLEIKKCNQHTIQ